MWVGWHHSVSRLPAATYLRTRHVSHTTRSRTCPTATTTTLNHVRCRGASVKSLFARTPPLFNKHDRPVHADPTNTENALRAPSENAATSAPAVSSTSTAKNASKDDHTAELLRRIARRGGGSMHRARPDVTAALFPPRQTSNVPTAAASAGEKRGRGSVSATGDRRRRRTGKPAQGQQTHSSLSPLARLFAAPPPPPLAEPSPSPPPPPSAVQRDSACKSSSARVSPLQQQLPAETPLTSFKNSHLHERAAVASVNVVASAKPSGGDAAKPAEMKLRGGKRGTEDTTQASPAKNPPVSTAPTSPPSRALLQKLLRTIQQEKRIQWDAIVRAHPDVAQMPLFTSREMWTAQIAAQGSASPLTSTISSSASSSSYSAPVSAPHQSVSSPLFLCAAATGTGKSVLLPLFALDAHWLVLEERLTHTLNTYDATLAQLRKDELTSSEREEVDVDLDSPTPFPLTSQADFIREFTACSRVCIVASQPTRVACAELARYVCLLLHYHTDKSDVPPTFSTSGVEGVGNQNCMRGDEEEKSTSTEDVVRRLLGKRIGYAVGGESRFCAETELIYATPGYVLNALQLTSPSSLSASSSPTFASSTSSRQPHTSAMAVRTAVLTPTTLMVDEAHCRDIETDSLLAWMKLSRQQVGFLASANTPRGVPCKSRHALRQYYVMSATMQLTAMDAYLSRPLQKQSTQKSRKEEEQTQVRRQKMGPSRGMTLRRSGGDDGGSDSGARDVLPVSRPLLLLSPPQCELVEAWWRTFDASTQSAALNGRQREYLQSSIHHNGSKTADKEAKSWSAQVQCDPLVRRAVLQVLEAAEGEVYNAGDGVIQAPQNDAQHPSSFATAQGKQEFATARNGASHDDSVLPQGIVVSTTPYRVERFFMEDLDPQNGCFEDSQVLFSPDARRAAAAGRAALSSSGSSNGSTSANQLSNTSVNVERLSSATNSNNSSNNAIQQAAPSFSFGQLPWCLTSEGRALRQHLGNVYGTRPAMYNLFSAQSRLLASFVLEILQAARQRWVDVATGASENNKTSTTATAMMGSTNYSPTTTTTNTPVTVILFMAGIAEMYQLMQTLERICEKVQQPPQQQQQQQQLSGYLGSENTQKTTVEVLRSGNEIFSVGLLHASAVGNPQEQLQATAQTGAPLRLLLTTNVAESSLTIPNTRVVLDTCLERRVRADDVTGATRVTTAFVSPSGLRQRCGRVGRTGDGVVIHLAPRHYVLPPAEALRKKRHHLSPQLRSPRRSHPGTDVHEVVDVGDVDRDHEDAADVSPRLDPLVDGVVTVLLHLKYFFTEVAAALSALPAPPTSAQLQVALQQLVDLELLRLPVKVPFTQHGDGRSGVSDTEEGDEIIKKKLTSPTLEELLNQSTFTVKGRLVAALPLPYEHACLVYHAFQFLCVEDAVLLACAMAVPTLFLTPRITAHSPVTRTAAAAVAARQRLDSPFTWTHPSATLDTNPALSPLENFYRRLWVQRKLAGYHAATEPEASFNSPTRASTEPKKKEGLISIDGTTEKARASEGAVRSGGHLSEPLMLRDLMRRWYAQSTLNEAMQLLGTLTVNRAAMRQVDAMVEQCCNRLLHLLKLQQEQQHGGAAAIRKTHRGHTSTSAEDAAAAEEESTVDVEDGQGTELDFGAYVCAAGPATAEGFRTNGDDASSPASASFYSSRLETAVLPFVESWPVGMQDQLARSLRRLQRAAHSRVRLRMSNSRLRSGVPQWHDSEQRWIQLCGRPYVRHGTLYAPPMPSMKTGSSSQNAMEAAGTHNDTTEEEKQREGEDTPQQRAVRHHPSFAYWGRQYPRHHLIRTLPGHTPSQRGLSTRTTTTIPYPSLTSNPPPLRTDLTRARSPVYRPPPPPPPVPPVAFVLGRNEERLCAAFVAAFGHRTMRGEDGSHRAHHRRLVRNLQTLEQDADHVCTFHIDVQPARATLLPVGEEKLARAQEKEGGGVQQVSSESVRAGEAESSRSQEEDTLASSPSALLTTPPTSYEALAAAGVTAEVIGSALAPYVAGAGLQQVEVFQSNRLAVAARFAASNFAPLWSQANTNTQEAASDVVEDENIVGGDSWGDAAHETQHKREKNATGDDSSDPCLPNARLGAELARATLKAEAEVKAGVPPVPQGAGDGELNLLKPIPLSHMRVPEIQTEPQRQQHNIESSSGSSIGHRNNPYVQLAPFGVSLLIAAVSGSGSGGLGGLQRIPFSASPTSPSPSLPNSSTADSSGGVTATASLTAAAPSESGNARRTAEVDARRGLHFTTTSGSSKTTVSWSDNYGMVSRTVTHAEVAALGLSELFPTPPPLPVSSALAAATATPSHSQQSAGAAATGQIACSPRDRGESSADADGQLTPRVPATAPSPLSHTFTLSVVPPVYITRSITWRVPLPTTIALPPSSPSTSSDFAPQRAGSPAASGVTSGRSRRTAPRTSLHYCVLCQHLCSSRKHFHQHCRSTAHMDHLYHAVQLGLTRTQLEAVYGYPSPQQQEEKKKRDEAMHSEGQQAEKKNPTKHTLSPPRDRSSGKGKASSSFSALTASSVRAALPLLSLFSLDHNRPEKNVHSLLNSSQPAPPAALSVADGGAAAAAEHSCSLRFTTQQLHPCVIHALSFLNCLQWTTRSNAIPRADLTSANEIKSSLILPVSGRTCDSTSEGTARATNTSTTVTAPSSRTADHERPADATPGFARSASPVRSALRGLSGFGDGGDMNGADRATPLAVAGGLVTMNTSADILPPAHLRQASSSSASVGESASDGLCASPASVAASTLAAHHVWVLDVSTPLTTQPSHHTTSLAAAPPPTSLLLVLAGYLAAASPQAMVALLFNRTHTHLHGVMLYGLGTFKLPTPLFMEPYAGVLERVAQGGGWPGLLVPVRTRGPSDDLDKTHREHQQQQQQQESIFDGLHWCAPTGTCTTCGGAATAVPISRTPSAPCRKTATVLTSSSRKPEGESVVEGEMRAQWSTVEATLLLTLHEYQQARRNMVTLVDYVERVLRKLQLSPFLTTSQASGKTTTDPEKEEVDDRVGKISKKPSSDVPVPEAKQVTASSLLAHYMAYAREGQGVQSLLRDVGCVFITPPHVLTALLNSEDGVEDDLTHEKRQMDGFRRDSHVSAEGQAAKMESAPSSTSNLSTAWSKRLSPRALNAEGAAVELMFTLPPVLPSVLPPVNFAEWLRAFYEARHEERWRAPRQHKVGSRSSADGAVNEMASTAGQSAGVGKRTSLRKGGGKWDDRLLF